MNMNSAHPVLLKHDRTKKRLAAHTLRGAMWAVLLVVSFGIPAGAQSNQIWPETGTYLKLTDQMRFYFLATTVKENLTSTEGELGPNFDFYLKPLRKLKRFGPFRLDESRNRLLMMRAGYRYLPTFSGEGPNENRGVLEATFRYPLTLGFQVSDRHRMDLRWISGDFSWRYRNRLTIERDCTVGWLKFTPYARGEIYYDNRYDKLSRNSLIGGSTFPLTRHIELEGYFEHQNDSGGSSNRTVNAVGVVLNLYFSVQMHKP
jgi:hypothetical protein